MLSHTQLKATVKSNLRESGTTYWSSTELDYAIVRGLRFLAQYAKHLVRVPYEIESRTGKASSSSPDNLVDATKAQFVSAAADVGKRVHNTTDNTWADIISFSSTSQVGLSHNIMASGESYEIFNKGCYAKNQINIVDIKNKLWVERVEFPIGTQRTFSISGDILNIDISFVPDDTADADANKLIYVWFAKTHKLSDLTTHTGTVYTAGSKSDKTLPIDAFTDQDVIEEDNEFTLASRPQVYTITAEKTLITGAWTTGGGTVAFYPGLDADVAVDIPITFIGSTLKHTEEMVMIEYVISQALMNEANLHLPSISFGGTDTFERYLKTASIRYNNALREMQSLAEPATAEILSTS